jgi:hypothetical protein
MILKPGYYRTLAGNIILLERRPTPIGPSDRPFVWIDQHSCSYTEDGRCEQSSTGFYGYNIACPVERTLFGLDGKSLSVSLLDLVGYRPDIDPPIDPHVVKALIHQFAISRSY